MLGDFSIPILAVTSLAVICWLVRPDWLVRFCRQFSGQISLVRGLIPRLLAGRNRIDRRWFFFGAAAAVAFDVFCCFAPFRGIGGDVDYLGFPFAFRIAGGYVYTVYWSWPAFAADLTVAVLIALVGGYGAIGAHCHLAGPRIPN